LCSHKAIRVQDNYVECRCSSSPTVPMFNSLRCRCIILPTSRSSASACNYKQNIFIDLIRSLYTTNYIILNYDIAFMIKHPKSFDCNSYLIHNNCNTVCQDAVTAVLQCYMPTHNNIQSDSPQVCSFSTTQFSPVITNLYKLWFLEFLNTLIKTTYPKCWDFLYCLIKLLDAIDTITSVFQMNYFLLILSSWKISRICKYGTYLGIYENSENKNLNNYMAAQLNKIEIVNCESLCNSVYYTAIYNRTTV